ncbi:MAG: cupin domain-containing protein [Oscillospiraceae bacterium]|nr:cupin domain-containing protein [Oscillospiraceae bacterium]
MGIASAFDINEVEWKDWGNGSRSAVYKPDSAVTMQYWEMNPGAGAQPHSHPAAQLTYVQAGFMDVIIDGVKYDLCPGCWAYIPANAIHSTLNRGQCLCINVDVFLPERDDRIQSEPGVKINHHCW